MGHGTDNQEVPKAAICSGMIWSPLISNPRSNCKVKHVPCVHMQNAGLMLWRQQYSTCIHICAGTHVVGGLVLLALATPASQPQMLSTWPFTHAITECTLTLKSSMKAGGMLTFKCWEVYVNKIHMEQDHNSICLLEHVC
jgi:hypothetical protein